MTVEKLKEAIRYDEWQLICKKCTKMILEDVQEIAVFYLDSMDDGICSIGDCTNKAGYYFYSKEKEKMLFKKEIKR